MKYFRVAGRQILVTARLTVYCLYTKLSGFWCCLHGDGTGMRVVSISPPHSQQENDSVIRKKMSVHDALYNVVVLTELRVNKAHLKRLVSNSMYSKAFCRAVGENTTIVYCL